ncbi:TOBE domain-containing protein [Actinotalea ferrariae]|uniref:TOBE domain-containing protein n=1 Tax=Actinotalea ferrariae TaxID=1386098 RepID=UPI001C8BE876|nr:TOBE domain-containing protein [Actinotalea ferrariae]MBX9246738.1 TOBE domain-containing protein [Actinotalea ferrariae]
MHAYRIRDVASLLGVSTDTVRRWVDAGRLSASTDEAGRTVVDGAELAAFAQALAAGADGDAERPPASQSVRNRFTGLVTRVVRDTVMAQVEIQAGPFRVVSLISREAADELGLEPGVLATATAKATTVAVERPTAVDLAPGGRARPHA